MAGFGNGDVIVNVAGFLGLDGFVGAANWVMVMWQQSDSAGSLDLFVKSASIVCVISRLIQAND
jgi:hypothetical protein